MEMDVNGYGKTAVKAVILYANGKASSIVDAWEIAARENFSTPSSQTKACPRTTFLGVCESGLVVGVPAGEYNSKLSENKKYGIKAIGLLRHNPELVGDHALLWKKIGNEALKYNSQMDVVSALWKNGLIKPKA
jgi:hypothetical protein